MPATIVGMRELAANLSQLPIDLEAKFGLQGLRAGATLVRKRLVDQLPLSSVAMVTVRNKKGETRVVKKSHLRELVTIRRLESLGRATRRRGSLGIRVGYRGFARIYGHIIEFGNSENAPRPVWRRVMRDLEREIGPRVAKKIVADVMREAKKRARK